MQTLEEIKQAVDQGLPVYWQNAGYQVIKDSLGHYLIQHQAGSCIGLTWRDGVTLNGKPEEFFTA
jgi:hypothetical protein